MKKWIMLVLCAVILSGCAAEETFETVSDVPAQEVSAHMREMYYLLPQEAASPVSESDSGAMYQCDGYEIMVQTMPSGDLDSTIRSVSGYSRDNVTVMQMNLEDWKRYEFVWASAGEIGDRIGKAAVLDDGNYHYVLYVLADADKAEQYSEVWQALLESFALV